MDAEVKRLFEQQQEIWKEYTAEVDRRIEEAKAKGAPDPQTDEKLAKMDAALDEIKTRLDEAEKKAARPAAGPSEGSADPNRAAYRKAFDRFVRKGDTAGFEDLRTKDWQVGVDADGGYAVPEELDRNILELLKDLSPMRQVCGHMTIGGVQYKRLVAQGRPSSGWVGETDPRNPTTTPTFTELSATTEEIYAYPFASQIDLEDVFFNAEQWLTQAVAEEFAIQEGLAFLSGDGNKKPKGILAHPSAAQKDGVRPFGTLEQVAGSAIDHDTLIDLQYSLKAGHRNNAVWMMNKATVAAVRKVKDSSLHPLWQPSLQLGQPSSLLGYPIVENEDMADAGGGNVPIIFGDFKRAYTIIDRVGISTLRDPYNRLGWVGFYTRKRVGGLLVDSEALKLLAM